MVKGKDIIPFHADWGYYIVPFPYESSSPRVPIKLDELSEKAPRLAKYYQDHKKLILEQTNYNEKIIGKENAEFYALARVGEYSYAENYVVFRDNTKWAAAVISEVETEWGGRKRPLFQNHAVSICEDTEGNFITLEEAHFICGIMNTKVVHDYMMQSSDSRSFPIRPRIYIPKFDEKNVLHKEIANLSELAHMIYADNVELSNTVEKIEKIYMRLLLGSE